MIAANVARDDSSYRRSQWIRDDSIYRLYIVWVLLTCVQGEVLAL